MNYLLRCDIGLNLHLDIWHWMVSIDAAKWQSFHCDMSIMARPNIFWRTTLMWHRDEEFRHFLSKNRVWFWQCNEISWQVLVPDWTPVLTWVRNPRLFLQRPPRLNSWSWTFMWHIQFRWRPCYASRIHFGALKLASSSNSFEFWSVALHVTSLLLSDSQEETRLGACPRKFPRQYFFVISLSGKNQDCEFPP